MTDFEINELNLKNLNNDDLLIISKKYNFNNNWSIWYHYQKNNWKISGYKKIYEITNIYDFWIFNNNLEKIDLLNNEHLFIMRENIKPIWEDVNNKNGGCWSIKISTNNLYDLWIKICMYIFGETLVDNNKIINGLSISSKNSNTSVIKIWISNSKDSNIKQLPINILNKYGYNIIYKAHIPEY